MDPVLSIRRGHRSIPGRGASVAGLVGRHMETAANFDPSEPMTNIEIVQEMYRAFRTADYAAFEAICTPDLEWIQMPGFPGGATWRGPQAVIEGVFRGNDGRWEGFGFDIAEYLDADTSVVVVGTYRGTHRTSGKSFSAPTVHICDIVDRRISCFRQFTDTKLICDALP